MRGNQVVAFDPEDVAREPGSFLLDRLRSSFINPIASSAMAASAVTTEVRFSAKGIWPA
jgi:hypothetical protein